MNGTGKAARGTTGDQSKRLVRSHRAHNQSARGRAESTVRILAGVEEAAILNMVLLGLNLIQ